jgi:sec-independent protein translocase protein TatB
MDFGPFGLSEILFIGGLALVVFGPRRLPEIGASAGRAVARLKRGLAELRRAYESELDEDTRRTIEGVQRDLREATRALDVAGRETWTQARTTADIARHAAQSAAAQVTAPMSVPASPSPSTPSTPSTPAPTEAHPPPPSERTP